MDAPRGEVAFEAFYRAHHRHLLAYCRRRVPHDAAHDVCNETFMVAWRRWADVPDGDTTRPWLYGVARRVLSHQYRSDQRRSALRSKLASVPEPAPPTPDHRLVESEEQRVVLDALAALKESDREVLRLAVWEELAHADIAIVLDSSRDAVAQRLSRARKRLADELERRDRARRTRPIGSPDRD